MRRLKMGDEWKELIDVDFPDMGPITDETREQIKEQSLRYRGSVRLSQGRFMTTDEYEEYRDRVRNTPLP